jgi:hypothetical protein
VATEQLVHVRRYERIEGVRRRVGIEAVAECAALMQRRREGEIEPVGSVRSGVDDPRISGSAPAASTLTMIRSPARSNRSVL